MGDEPAELIDLEDDDSGVVETEDPTHEAVDLPDEPGDPGG